MVALASGPSRQFRPVWPTLAAIVGILLLLAWLVWRVHFAAAPAPQPAIERQARRFVSLALTLGKIAPDEVDSYFGPADLKPVAGKASLPELRADLADLAADLRDSKAAATPRGAILAERTDRMITLVNVMGPVPPLSFDDEARRLYALPPPALDTAAFARARAALEELLPGDGPLSKRVEAFRSRFVIPPDKREAVFRHALAECRRRTLLHWQLPQSERVDVQFTDAVDAAWHRYQGNLTSILQINPNAVALLGSAIDVACHEGYPGHHVQFVLAEAAAGPGGLPIENRVVLLRSPASVLREGAADFGVALVFPAAERIAFERDVLMPLAGLAQADAARFGQVRDLLARLAPAAFPILRAYRNGTLDKAAAAAALERDALVASPLPLLEFTDGMGAYVAGYTSVREQVRQSAMAPGAGDPWARLRCLLAAADGAPLANPKAIDGPGCIKQTNEARS